MYSRADAARRVGRSGGGNGISHFTWLLSRICFRNLKPKQLTRNNSRKNAEWNRVCFANSLEMTNAGLEWFYKNKMLKKSEIIARNGNDLKLSRAFSKFFEKRRVFTSTQYTFLNGQFCVQETAALSFRNLRHFELCITKWVSSAQVWPQLHKATNYTSFYGCTAFAAPNRGLQLFFLNQVQ